PDPAARISPLAPRRVAALGGGGLLADRLRLHAGQLAERTSSVASPEQPADGNPTADRRPAPATGKRERARRRVSTNQRGAGFAEPVSNRSGGTGNRVEILGQNLLGSSKESVGSDGQSAARARRQSLSVMVRHPGREDQRGLDRVRRARAWLRGRRN